MAAKPYATAPKPPVTYNYSGGIGLADPASEAAKRAQSRLDSGTLAAQQSLATRLQGYDQSRTRMKDDAEWALRTGAEANMRHLTGQNAVNSGLRDRFAERLQGQVGRPLTRGLEDISAQADMAKGQTAESIAQLQANLPVMQAEELARQYQTEGLGITNAVNEASMTGRYMPPAAQGLINQILNAKSAWEQAQGGGDQAGMDQAHQTADQARATLAAMGVSPNLFGADIARGTAERNVGQAGMPTPAARELASALSGVDPMTGQPTLAGKQANQVLTMGDLQNQVAANPNYGLGAKAAADIASTNADIAYRNKLGDAATVNAAKSGTAAKNPKTVIDRKYIADQWGLARTSPFTTDYAALDNYIQDWVNNAGEQTVTMADVQQWAAEQRSAIRADHVDPQDVVNAMQLLLSQDGGGIGGGGSSAGGGRAARSQ